MNKNEYLLTCLSEECSEISQNVGKTLRFGINDRNILNPSGPTNKERLVEELNDLLAITEMLIDCDILPAEWQNRLNIDTKKSKVKKFMDYSIKQGTLKI